MKSENSLIHKKNSKRIKELNIMPYTIKLSKENIGRTLFDVTCSKIFFDPPPRVMKLRAKINKQDLIKLTNLCTAKEIINKNEKTTQKIRENI